MEPGTEREVRHTEPSRADGWYLYGVVPADIDIDVGSCAGMDGCADVQLIHTANLYALASRVDPRLRAALEEPDYAELTDRIVDHDRVLRVALATGRTVVPVPFGVVLSDLNELRRLLAAHAGELHEALERLEGCQEYGVHVSVPREAAQPAVRTCARGVYEQLAACAEDAIIEPVNAGARESRPSILSAAFLVNRDRQTNFRRTAEELARVWDLGGFTVRVSGPWPAYDFARVSCGMSGPAGATVLLGPLSEPEGSWATATRVLMR